MKEPAEIPVLTFADGTIAVRIPYATGHPDDEEDWTTFAVRAKRSVDSAFFRFPLVEGRTVLPGMFMTGLGFRTPQQTRDAFARHGLDFGRKVRAIVRTFQIHQRHPEPVEFPKTQSALRKWVLSDLVPEELFVQDDLLPVDSPQGPEETAVEYVQRILPTFRLFSWWDESLPPTWKPEGWQGPVAGQISWDTPAGRVSGGGAKRMPVHRSSGNVVGEYDMVLVSGLPLRYIRVVHDETNDQWTVRYEDGSGWSWNTADLCGRLHATAHRPSSLPDMLRLFFRYAAHIEPESKREEWERTMVEPVEDVLTDPEDDSVLALLGEQSPALWPWDKLVAWARTRD